MTNPVPTTPLGAVVRDGDGYRLEFVREFAEPVEQVWAAFADSNELAGWFGTWSGDPGSGTISLHMAEAPEPGPAEVVECTPPTRLSLVTISPDGPWPLTIDLAENGSGTRLTFTHTLAEPYDATSIGAGWQFYLDRMTAHLAGEPIPDDWDSYAQLGEKYPLPE